MRKPSAQVPVLAAILAILDAGCATNHSPRESGRIHFVLNSQGEESLEKDGQRYPIGGFLGGQLPEAVKGHAVAEQRAREYVFHKETSSIYATLSGIALVATVFCLIGMTAEPAGGAPEEQPRDNRGTLKVAMGISGVVGIAALVGAVIHGEAAQRNLYDAINIYNDDVAGRAP